MRSYLKTNIKTKAGAELGQASFLLRLQTELGYWYICIYIVLFRVACVGARVWCPFLSLVCLCVITLC